MNLPVFATTDSPLDGLIIDALLPLKVVLSNFDKTSKS